ncbi:hypothetical protein KUTeg_016146 [Tegillarca granosa]|uniref:Uncharacterized protein n=1 Tax=Tegillarca granosa TaxID=220873 RepID=A0ABQ9EK18_TEGGR|nr:hypothetical protein KUTeg_016146 [Tegillarca granosa]
MANRFEKKSSSMPKKKKSKKGKRKKHKNFENTQEDNLVDTVQGLQIDSDCVNLDLETAWQKYWDSYGEYLVWEGWVNKYPEQIDFDVYNAIPCVAEEEVCTDEQTHVIKSDEDSDVVSGTASLENCPTKKSDTCTINPDQCLIKESADKCVTEDSSFVSKNTDSFSPHQFTNYQTSYNNAIQTTMRDRFENQDNTDVYVGPLTDSNQPEESIENMNNHESEVVHMMHTYASVGSFKGDNSSNPADEGEMCSEIIDTENGNGDYDIAWQELWNEHYTESFWYYYSEFRKSFNQLKSSNDPANVTSGVQNVYLDEENADSSEQNIVDNSQFIDIYETNCCIQDCDNVKQYGEESEDPMNHENVHIVKTDHNDVKEPISCKNKNDHLTISDTEGDGTTQDNKCVNEENKKWSNCCTGVKKKCGCKVKQNNKQTDQQPDCNTSLPSTGMIKNNSGCSHSDLSVNVNNKPSKKCDASDNESHCNNCQHCQKDVDKNIIQCQSGESDKLWQCTSSDNRLCQCRSSDDEVTDGGGEGKRRSKTKPSDNTSGCQGLPAGNNNKDQHSSSVVRGFTPGGGDGGDNPDDNTPVKIPRSHEIDDDDNVDEDENDIDPDGIYEDLLSIESHDDGFRDLKMMGFSISSKASDNNTR